MATLTGHKELEKVPYELLEDFFPSDEKRAQELDTYYNPGESSFLHLTERDTALPAHMQLVAWRLGMQRALVSLIDRDTQYHVAECTKTMDLHDPNIFRDETDSALFINKQHPKTGTLCSETIKAKAGSDGEPAHFEICDLSTDPRYCNMSFVRNELHLVYYCGVPIRTNNNIVIGAVYVLDNKVREPLDVEQLKFLSAMADNVMVHLETRKEKMDIKRIMRMNKSLAQFVDNDQGEVSSGGDDESDWTKVSTDHAFEKPVPDDHQIDRDGGPAQTQPYGSGPTGSDSGGRDSVGKSAPSSAASDDEIPKGNVGREYSQIFSRAAYLLRQALVLQNSGGVFFLDTASKSTSRNRGVRPPPKMKTSLKAKGQSLEVNLPSEPTRTPSEEGKMADDAHNAAAVLACSVSTSSFSLTGETCSLEEKSPSKIPVKILLKFIRKAPGGKVWHYPDLHASCDPSTQELDNARPRRDATEDDLRIFFSYLPGARQLVFVPFWNTHLSRWSVCLAYTLSLRRELTFEIDYYFCRAFCNCVKAEIDRCTVVLSDQQKGDFIGSVSHELRSPLHGILASCELIQETELTPFQDSLIDTTESCAHTLLDTINMVLDFSKINAFAKNQPGESLNVKPHIVKGGVEPLLSIYSNVNVAAIAEEVIEGITTGHFAKSDPGIQLSGNVRGDSFNHESKAPGDPSQLPRSPIEIILDVAPPQSWSFTTQPGAYRRVLMNLFGNALKYTEHGFIKVFLRCEDIHVSSSEPPKAMVTLTVTDSGKGISKSYMETKMFTAFAQENALAPGTGLGLSLVRSIVEMLEGEINVQSEVGKGTTVMVKIPMKRVNAETPGDAFHRPNDSDIQTVRKIDPKPRIVIFNKDSLPEDDTPQKIEAYKMQSHALSSYISGWFAVDPMQNWDSDCRPDVVLVDELHIPAVLKHLKDFEACGASIIVMCSDRSQTTAITKAITYPRLIVMPKPFGPFKLGKVLRIALEKHVPLQTPSAATPTGPSIDDQKEKLPIPALRHRASFASSSEEEGTGKRLRFKTSPSIRPIEPAEGFPFPTMEITPASRTPTPSIPLPTPQIESEGTHHRRLKTLDAPLSQQDPHIKHDDLVRSHSDSAVARLQKHRKPRVLLVDDNELNLKLLQTFFVRHGYEDVTLARDGVQAINAYEASFTHCQLFDIVFMDISMPVMDGFEATKKIRQMENTATPQRPEQSITPHQSLIVALTGNASAKDQTNAFTHGMDLYMTKPVSLKEVGELMRCWEEYSKMHGTEQARNMLLEVNASE